MADDNKRRSSEPKRFLSNLRGVQTATKVLVLAQQGELSILAL